MGGAFWPWALAHICSHMSALTGHQDDGAQDDDEEVEVWDDDEDVAKTISLQELRQKGGNGLEVAGAIMTDENNK